MAIVAGLAGVQAKSDSNRNPIAGPVTGAAATVASGAGSANIALPADAAGKPYPAFLVTTSQAAWVCWSNAADAAVASAANTILLPANFWDILAPPAGATSISAIQDTAAGKVCLTGVF